MSRSTPLPRTAVIPRPQPSRAAFTLIEILVVVAIIALLVAILLPSLARVRAQGRSAVCASNVRQMGVAMTLFSTEHRSRVPRGISRHAGSLDPYRPVNWVRMVARMFGDKTNYSRNLNRVPVEKLEVFWCPERGREYGGGFLDYVVNSTDHRGPITLSPCEPNPTGGAWYEVEGVTKIDVWRRPGEVIYVTEAVRESWGVNDANNSWGTMKGIRENIDTIRQPEPPTATGLDWFDIPGGSSVPYYLSMLDPGNTSDERKPRAALKMHLKRGSNAVFADGHVKLVKPPPAKVGALALMRFYMRLLGVDRDLVGSITTIDTTAAFDPCTAGDTDWRP